MKPCERYPAGPSRRRALLLLGSVAASGLCAPLVVRAAEAEALTTILARSGLGRETGFALADARTGALIEAHQPDLDRPPASVVKIVTALWALEVLGPGYRFRTELRAGSPVEGGRLPGGLVLAGGGDPVLDTDALGGMAGELARGGLRDVAAFRVDGSALPAIAVTEADQPAFAGYNPAIGGVNLNFNRVRLAWAPGQAGPALALEAPGQRHTVSVGAIRAEIAEAQVPSHRLEDAAEVWRVPRASLRGKGEIWLPVRRPDAYAGDVFGRLAARAGVTLPPAGGTLAGGRLLVARDSAALEGLMRGMLQHSTNLTAEVAGLAAARAQGVAAADLAASAGAMGEWARERWALRRATFANHSGLTLRSVLTAREMTRILAAAPGLGDLLPERPILDARGDTLRGPGVRAKTGTMHFLRGYAGYLPARGRPLAFAIFAADPAARDALDPANAAPPPGARDWTAKARAQENALLRRWIALHA